MIKLALNATSLLSPLTGIGQYTRNLALELMKLGEVDLDFFYSSGWSKNLYTSPSHTKSNLVSKIKPFIPFAYELRRFWHRYNFSTYANDHTFNIYHEPNYLLMPFNGPSVVTIHDLSWLNYPEMHPTARVRALNAYFPRSLQTATLIITDSEFIKQEVVRTFSINPSRIEAIPLGVEETFSPKTDTESKATLPQYGMRHNSYFLTVGTFEPRKILQLALTAYQALPSSLRKHYPLVIVGMKGWHTHKLQHAMNSLVNSGEIRLLGYIPRHDLAMITAGATTLVYPSVYEGFGLPPLEAMACAVPPIVSDASSLPEVVAGGGIKISPSNADALSIAMQQLAEDLPYQKKLGVQALARAQELTWQQCAKHTYHLYQRAISLY